MAEAKRSSRVVWRGDLKGEGHLSTLSSGLIEDKPVTFAARTGNPDGKTSPEELLAGAHAACYSMALSNVLAQTGHPPEQLEVEATAAFDDGQLKITTMELNVSGRVPGMSAEDFEGAAQEAERACPVSNAIRAGVEIHLHASLSG